MRSIVYSAGWFAVLFAPALYAALDNPVTETPEMMRAYAEMGDPAAQYNLALLKQKDAPSKEDLAEAAAWFRKAAMSGFPLAQHNLGVLLSKGEGVTKDEKEAVRWFYAAAGQGVFAAQKAMIECYARGLGVEKNAAQALTWDFLARRSLELRYEQPAGEPPKPAKLRADGFAEYTTPEGQTEAIGPDGSVEKTNADGTKTLQRADGGKTTVAKSGERETRYPDGKTITEHPDGRREIRLSNGDMLTEYPDGRKVAKDRSGVTETLFPDGTRELEGEATTSTGKRVPVREKLDKDGKRLWRRIVNGLETIEELPDGTRLVETTGEDEEGRKVRVINSYSAEGVRGQRRLVREDGVERSGEEFWVIKRWVNTPDGKMALMKERYGLGNSSYDEEVIETRDPSATPTPARVGARVRLTPVEVPAMPPNIVPLMPEGPAVVPMGPLPRGTAMPANPLVSSFDPQSAPVKPVRVKASIDTQLAELAKLERQALYFAGASESDYERARTTARTFVLNLPVTPQKQLPANAPATRLNLRGSPPPLPGFVRLATDRSEQHPLGMHGRVAMKIHPWQHTETEHFVVHYIDPKEAYSVMGDIECTFINVAEMLQLETSTLRRKSHVFIFPNAASWKAFKESLGLPEAVAGFAYKSELYLGVREDREKYLQTLCHEATHAVVSRFYPARKWPLWLTEGFAEYMSAKQLELRRSEKPGPPGTPAPRRGTWRLEVDRVFYRTDYGIGGEKVTLENGVKVDSTALFYAESERCVRTLIEKLPPRNFPRFANLAFAGNAIPVCLREAYGSACSDVPMFQGLVNSAR